MKETLRRGEYKCVVLDAFLVTPLGFAMAYGHVAIAKALVTGGADPRKLRPYHGNALLFAVRLDDADLLRTLLQLGLKVEEELYPGRLQKPKMPDAGCDLRFISDPCSILSAAVQFESLVCLDILLQHKAELERFDIEVNDRWRNRIPSWCKLTPLMHATILGNIEAMRRLLAAGANVGQSFGASDNHSFAQAQATALSVAAFCGNTVAFKVLESKGADKLAAPSAISRYLQTFNPPTWHGYDVQSSADLIENVLFSSPEPFRQLYDSPSASRGLLDNVIDSALNMKNVSILSLVLRLGIDADATIGPDSIGVIPAPIYDMESLGTPAVLCLLRELPESWHQVVSEFVKGGQKIVPGEHSRRLVQADSSSMDATMQERMPSWKFPRDLSKVDEWLDLLVCWLTTRDLNLNEYETNGCSLLHLSVLRCKHEVTTMLLKAGCDTNHRNQEGHTPLHYALLSGCTRSLSQLLEHCCQVDSENDGDLTPLLQLSKVWDARDPLLEDRWSSWGILPPLCECRGDVLHQLLSSGADADGQDQSGRTALSFAAAAWCLGAVKTLIKFTARPARRDSLRQTPLHYALVTTDGTKNYSEGERAQIVELLGRHPAFDIHEDVHQESPFSLAMELPEDCEARYRIEICHSRLSASIQRLQRNCCRMKCQNRTLMTQVSRVIERVGHGAATDMRALIPTYDASAWSNS